MKKLHLIFAAVFALFLSVAKVAAAATAIVACNLQKGAGLGQPVLALGANTLTNLIPDVYAALDVVSRELTGFIPAVGRNSTADRVAANQTLRSIATRANTSGANITPAMSLPSASDQTVDNKSLTITKQRAFKFSWTGEEQKSMDAGPGYLTIEQDQIAQAIRAAVNEVEVDVATAAYQGASRAYGTAGTTPFATNLADTAQIKKILDDNGAPNSDRHLIIDTTAGAAMRTLTQLTKANEAADTTLLRQGVLLDVHGFAIRESAQIQTPTAGTGASYQLNGAHSAGATTISVDTGTGTILAGDVVTINSVKYVVASALSGGSFTINAPGLRTALSDNTAVTVNAAAARNVAFSRNAIVLATRLPAVPKQGDLAILREVITDARTGLSFELAVYPGYRMNVYEIGLCWGVTVFKNEHVATLLG